MATPRFNANILTAAARLQDRRTDPTSAGDAGMTFISSRLAGYQNEAIRDMVLEMYKSLGSKIVDVIPELVKESSVLTLVGGEVAKPSDAWMFLDLRTDDELIVFTKLTKEIGRVKAGKTILNPDDDPVFWESDGKLFVLPVDYAGAEVLGYYVVTPEDIEPSTVSAGAGGANGTGGSYVAATKTLTCTVTPIFSASMVGKKVVFADAANNVYVGRIVEVTSGTVVVLSGDFLPAGNVGTLTVIVMAETGSGDVKLDPVWDGEIVRRMIDKANQDVKATVAA